ncbi:Helix-turn-helix domain-containing protein [Mesorhizobium albiziae]|uniref:Helix-turn-helix domain-containing protein n=1 Tax=Neomesorhizobium albiziae TaxID=335020 RepID=A0A1I4C5D0_9HYPH|nr:helix-turn-helix transcriptional regulator [Mesorhizobium albiziae]GLS29425.1 transcriptional regulator [Mesorhizobium albiziae]SFK76344.1 Helix-turn-helix domain-containing protein [Mesorhizobium albiziae]
MNIAEIFAANLRAVRVARGISQAKLANSAGLNTKYVGRLERGRQSPALTTVAAIADALSIEPAEFIAHDPSRVIKLASST